jgi:hypothetical protein
MREEKEMDAGAQERKVCYSLDMFPSMSQNLHGRDIGCAESDKQSDESDDPRPDKKISAHEKEWSSLLVADDLQKNPMRENRPEHKDAQLLPPPHEVQRQ